MPLEALVIDEGVVQDDARCDSPVLLDERVCQAVPGRLDGKGRDVFVGDLGRHSFEVTGLLLLTDTGGRPLELGLVSDEGVVRRASVEAHAGSDNLTLVMAFLVGVTDDRHDRHDHCGVRR